MLNSRLKYLFPLNLISIFKSLCPFSVNHPAGIQPDSPEQMNEWDIYRRIIMQLLEAYTQRSDADSNIHNEIIFDPSSDQYFVMSVESYQDSIQWIQGCLIHIDIIDDKIWIKRDKTEERIANQLVELGIPKDIIILGFGLPDYQKYPGFALA